jgi:pimeloyl-ACP methyl ester carboxylesterase
VRAVTRQFVSSASASAGRNGAGYLPCQGLYFHPQDGPAPRIAFIASHYNVDFSEHYLGQILAARGYGFLGWNTRFRGNEPYFLLEHALLDIAAGVTWLRARQGIEVVILLGNSGGGSLMAAYQSQAVEADIPPALGLSLPDAFSELPRADGYVSLCAHRGRPEVLTDWLDPSVLDENNPTETNPELDMYHPDNGPPYSSAFLNRYRSAQIARNRRISDWALQEYERVTSAGVSDRVFVLFRAWADPRFMDPALDPSNRPAATCYAGDPRRANYGAAGLGVASTLRTWLNMWSLDHSPCRGERHLGKITVPALVLQADADTGVFPSDAAAIAVALASADKVQHTVPGDHYLLKPATAREDTADLIHDWVGGRF